jgi:carboxypeptidase Taq
VLENLEFARREAAYLGRGDAPYDYALDKHDPGSTAAAVDRLFGELKRDLVPLVRQITASPKAQRAAAIGARLKGFGLAEQGNFLREVTARLGFDYSRGRIDVSLHPFCSGTGSDVRMTTRYREDQPLDALYSSIHETGHGLYEQGLPAAQLGTGLGIHAGMAVHESQSRLWENQVARSRGFWRHFEPRWRELFPTQTAQLSSEELYRLVNAVEPTSIRVDADEVTYNLHIILRFELEKRLFSGELAVRDLPAAWKTASREIVGLEPADDRTGVLQDVHWSDGAFGYFPSYCLGNMIAAQLWATVRAQRPTWEDDFARGDFAWLLAWLRAEVHAHGRRHSALELVQKITGEELSPRHLVAYLRRALRRALPRSSPSTLSAQLTASLMSLIDTHTHLESFARSGALPDTLRRAREADLEAMITIGTGSDDWELYRWIGRCPWAAGAFFRRTPSLFGRGKLGG